MKLLSFLTFIVCLYSCSNISKKDATEIVKSALSPSLLDEIEVTFKKKDINGCFILHDVDLDTSLIYNVFRSKQKFLPASTFKILNSLIALECEVVADEYEVIPWDSVERQISIWNRDHNMKTGIKYSVVWFYQELARRIGEDRMQAYVDSVGYGNQHIGKHVDDFWLVGDLRISPLDQVEFVKRFIKEDLPFQKENIETVKEILIEDSNEAYIFRAKTGWADYGIPVGWYVGYIELDGKTYVFVNNIEINSSEDARSRKEITKEIFRAAFDIDLKI